MVRLRYNRGWSRRGFALLWCPETLAGIATSAEVSSLRQFFAMVDNWPDELPSEKGDTLIVSGVEGCIDVLDAKDAERWIESDLRQAVLSFQDAYQGQAGLVFWLPSGRTRITMRGASEEYYYHHRGAGEDGLHIGRLLWSGAENEIERIMSSDAQDVDYDGKHWAGLHHPRIS